VSSGGATGGRATAVAGTGHVPEGGVPMMSSSPPTGR
jgi:hypothetical protein